MMMKNTSLFYLILVIVSFCACKSGPFNLLKPASPHEQYERKLVTAGLDQTKMGMAWINNSQAILQKALTINLPYQENGYFSSEKIEGAAFKFNLTRGMKLQVRLTSKPTTGFRIYADFWEQPAEGNLKLLGSIDTLTNALAIAIEKTGQYVLRLQPELLSGGSYTLEITTGPSLGYPLKTSNRNQIQSLYGVGRDENTRKHEGIDIFAAFRTPVLAVSSGTITGVNSNNLGGKVVWFRPSGKNYTLYYAHLDEQTVTEGQSVLPGDTLGRMGNTGNAKTTPPHLHFGIYTNSGAIDPLPFINPIIQDLPKVYSSSTLLNTTMRTNVTTNLAGANLKTGTVVRVTAATGNDYRVELPDGKVGYLTAKNLTTTTKPLLKYKAKVTAPVFDQPALEAAIKLNLSAGQTVDILGNFNNYQLVLDANNQTGWIKKNPLQ